jgi:hypothetical protein
LGKLGNVVRKRRGFSNVWSKNGRRRRTLHRHKRPSRYRYRTKRTLNSHLDLLPSCYGWVGFLPRNQIQLPLLCPLPRLLVSSYLKYVLSRRLVSDERDANSLPLRKQPPALLPSPPSNPLSLQNGFASAFSHPFPQHSYPQPFSSHPQYPHPTQQSQQYDPMQAWYAQPGSENNPLPDDVFAAMLSYAGRDAMTTGDAGLGSTDGQGSSSWQF